MSQLNSELKMYREALSQDLRLTQWSQIPVFAEMIGHIGGTNDFGYPKTVPYGSVQGKRLRPTGKPIEVLTDWNHQGGYSIDIPILLPMIDKPVVGNKNAKGQEEDRRWIYNRAWITLVRKPAKVTDGLMGELALNPKLLTQIWNNLKQEFQHYNQRLQAYSPYDAMYQGFDQQLLDTTELSLTRRSHPNFYVAGYGRVAFNSTNSAYETAIAAQLTNLGSTDTMSVQVIRNLAQLGAHHLIVPTTAGPYAVKGVMIISDAQMRQLVEDALFEKVQIQMVTKDGSNAPFFSGAYASFLIEGVLVLVDINNPGVWISGDSDYDSSRGTINYGNSNPLANPIHNSDIKLGIYMGASAILCGSTRGLTMENETDDYKNVKGECSQTVIGYNRADRFDHDGFLADSESITNTSSMVFATYSPNSPTWGSGTSS